MQFFFFFFFFFFLLRFDNDSGVRSVLKALDVFFFLGVAVAEPPFFAATKRENRLCFDLCT